MKTLIVHIGRQKTGTSSIQSALDGHRDWLSKQGIWYPDTGRDGIVAHHALARTLNPRQSDEQSFSDMMQRFDREVRDRPEPVIIISSEGFQNIQDLERTALFGTGYRLHVICYLRECLAWKQSAWAQRVHAQAYVSGFMEYALSQTLDYAAFIRRWGGLTDDVTLGLFDPDFLFNANVVDDFFMKIGRELSSEESSLITPVDENPSIGGNLLYFKLLLNLVSASHDSFNGRYNRLSRLAASEPRWRGRFRVSEEDATSVRTFEKASNAVLAQHFGACPERDTTALRPVPDVETLPTDFEYLLGLREYQELMVPLGLQVG